MISISYIDLGIDSLVLVGCRGQEELGEEWLVFDYFTISILDDSGVGVLIGQLWSLTEYKRIRMEAQGEIERC
jgi:hypothetical protein